MLQERSTEGCMAITQQPTSEGEDLQIHLTTYRHAQHGVETRHEDHERKGVKINYSVFKVH